MVLSSQRNAHAQQQADPHTHSLSEGPDTTSGPSAFLQVPPSPTGSTASMQATEGAALTVDDPASTELVTPVRTVYSMASLDFQIVERADKVGLDNLVSREILGAVLAQQEAQVLNGSGSNGEVLGLLGTSSAGSISLTATSAYDLLDSVARAAQASHEATGQHPDVVVMAPRRWKWFLAKAGDRP